MSDNKNTNTHADSPDFRNELCSLINKHNMERGSNTPDFILNQFLADVLMCFNAALAKRDEWYNICNKIGIPPEPTPMRCPTFDSDGYPTDETLKTIEAWDSRDWPGLVNYLRSAWNYTGRIWEEDGFLKLATGGWSGNESIIGALQNNHVFWAMYWESSHSGGLFVFRIPTNEKQ